MIKKIKFENPFKNILDSLKRPDGTWSTSSLTMFTAWCMALYIAFYDLYTEGFRYDVFVTFVGVALGAKTMDSISKKIKQPKKDKDGPDGI